MSTESIAEEIVNFLDTNKSDAILKRRLRSNGKSKKRIVFSLLGKSFRSH